VALDVRNGRMSKEEGQHLVEQYEGRRPPSLDLFLEFIGITEAEFLEIAMSHQVTPYVHDPASTKEGARMPDFDRWNRDGAMPREEAAQVMELWRSRKE
jgi:hypothetical protein